MNVFEYTIALFSIVLALGIARVLGGLADLLRLRLPQREKWFLLIWLIFLFTNHIGWWFSLWQLNDLEQFGLVRFFSLMVAPVSLYLATRLLVPEESQAHQIIERYETVRIPFLLILIFSYAMPIVLALANGSIPDFVLFLVPVITALSIAALFRNTYVQFACSAIALGIYVSFLIIRRTHVGG